MGRNLVKEIMLDGTNNETVLKLKKFVSECAYLCHAETIRRVSGYIQSGCQFKAAVKVLGNVDVESLRTSVWYANVQLKKLLGENILDKVRAGEEIAEELIDFAIAHPDDILLPQVEGFIPSYQYRRYELRDCEQELKFLRFYSYYALKRNVQKMDKNKMAYIHYLLEYPSDADVELGLRVKQYFTYSL